MLRSSTPARDLHLTFVNEDLSWQEQGRCVRYVALGGSSLWVSDEPRDQDRAKELCLSCPVFVQCDSFAKRNRTMLCGVYAGIYYSHHRYEDEPTKTCIGCFEDKPQSEFYETHGARCKQCWNKSSNEARKRRQRELLTSESSRS